MTTADGRRWRIATSAVVVVLSAQIAWGRDSPAGTFEPRKSHKLAAKALAKELGFTDDFDTPAQPMLAKRPLYPEEAIEKCVEGTVLVLCGVDASGVVVATRILEGIPELDAAALAAARSWRFEPAKKDGHPVGAVGFSAVEFRFPAASRCRKQQGDKKEEQQAAQP